MPNEIKVGDYVRSFDFPDRDRSLIGDGACYLEGPVEAILPMHGCDRYKIRAVRRVFAGEDISNEIPAFDPYAYPPVNGTPTLMGKVTNGVEKIDKN